MTDAAIHEFSPVEDPAVGTLLLIETNPGASGDYHSLAIENLRKRDHGHIYAPDITGTQTLLATTWTDVSQFTVNGLSQHCAGSFAAGTLTPASIGRWRVGFHASFVGVHGVTYKVAVHYDGAIQSVRDQVIVYGTFGKLGAIGMIDCDPASLSINLKVWASEAAIFNCRELGLWAVNEFPHT